MDDPVRFTASGSTETIKARAFSTSGAPDIASGNLAPLRDKWVTVEWTITPGGSGTVGFVLRNGTGANAPIAFQGKRSGVRIPDEGDYIRPKWGIYRSVQSASSDILDTYINFRNYTATKKSANSRAGGSLIGIGSTVVPSLHGGRRCEARSRRATRSPHRRARRCSCRWERRQRGRRAMLTSCVTEPLLTGLGTRSW